jgi:hypothetical protein
VVLVEKNCEESNLIGLTASWKAGSHLAVEEIFHLLWDAELEYHYHLHKGLTLDSPEPDES